jgi:phosphoglucosamine mutase
VPTTGVRKSSTRAITERKLFGTDGIRGKANVDPMTPELALRLGRAITQVAERAGGGPAPRILIGKDTRLSGYMLETALASGICSMGGTVLLTGPLPTPAVANLTQSMRADMGVVISASHNAYEDNGIKLFGPSGYKLPDADEAHIEGLMADPKLERRAKTYAKVGRAERIDGAAGRYVVYVKSTFPRSLHLKGVRVVVDAAHGAAYHVAPEVFEELGATVFPVGCKPNGKNINHRCGALHPELVAHEVSRHHAHIGIALDGDADRLVVVDERGEVIDGDAVMALCATRLLAKGKLARRTLITTVMSNMGLEHAVQAAGGKLARTQVGDRYVVEAMQRGRYNFGGEQSGHLIFSDHATTGDGLVAALQVLAIAVGEQQPLSELKRVLTRVPQVLVNVTLTERRPLERMPNLSKAIARVERKLGKKGRVLVRWSGTEPKLRVMVEGPERRLIERLAHELCDEARRDVGAKKG